MPATNITSTPVALMSGMLLKLSSMYASLAGSALLLLVVVAVLLLLLLLKVPFRSREVRIVPGTEASSTQSPTKSGEEEEDEEPIGW